MALEQYGVMRRCTLQSLREKEGEVDYLKLYLQDDDPKVGVIIKEGRPLDLIP